MKLRNLLNILSSRSSNPINASVTKHTCAGEPLVYELIDKDHDNFPRSLISVLGVLPDNVDLILDSVIASCCVAGEFPIIVLSNLRTDLVSARLQPCEFIPTSRELRFLDKAGYQRYVRKRWAFILAKWRIQHEIVLGLSLDEFLSTMPEADCI